MFVLLQLARRLQESALPVSLLLWEKPQHGTAALLESFTCLPLDQVKLNRDDLYIVPEGWVNALSPGLQAKSRCIVYCQNWAYLFHGLPKEIRWKDLDVQFWAVSYPVAIYLENVLGKSAPIVRPVLDRDIFQAPVAKPRDIVRVGCMPRKNKAQIEQVKRIFKERNPGQQVEWWAIQDADQAGVARSLQNCHIFLCTGFPEGFSLPPLEAMACACLPVGFTGYGGWDYMRQYQKKETDPDCLMREVPWQGNGLWSADGDTLSLALDLEKAINWWQNNPQTFQKVLREGQETSRAYNTDRQREELLWALKSKL